jgi:hypothetical protein
MNDIHETVADLPEVKSLKFGIKLELAKTSHQDLVAQVDNVMGWTDEEYIEQFKNLDDMTTSFKKSFANAQAVFKTVELIRLDANRLNNNTTRAERSRIQKTAKVLVLGKLHAMPAELLAEGLASLSASERTLSTLSTPNLEFDVEQSDFVFPRCFLKTEGNDRASHWHLEITKALKSAKSKLTALHQKAVRQLSHPSEKDAHGIKYLGADAIDFSFNIPQQENTFEVDKSVSVVFVCQENLKYTDSTAIYPLKGLPCFVGCHEGYILVLMIPLRECVDVGAGLQNMDAYFEKLEGVNDLRNFSCKVGLAPGHGCFVPFGWMAMIVGVPQGDNYANQGATYSSYIMQYVPCKKFGRSCSARYTC